MANPPWFKSASATHNPEADEIYQPYFPKFAQKLLSTSDKYVYLFDSSQLLTRKYSVFATNQ